MFGEPCMVGHLTLLFKPPELKFFTVPNVLIREADWCYTFILWNAPWIFFETFYRVINWEYYFYNISDTNSNLSFWLEIFVWFIESVSINEFVTYNPQVQSFCSYHWVQNYYYLKLSFKNTFSILFYEVIIEIINEHLLKGKTWYLIR